MKKLSCFFCMYLVFCSSGRAQDIHFSQYTETPLLVNPALTGAFEGNFRLSTNYKNQWSTLSRAYRTFGFSYDMGILRSRWENAYLGIGVNAFRDVAGDIKMGTSLVGVNASGIVFADNNNAFCGGIQGAIGLRSADESQMITENQFNGVNYVEGASTGEEGRLESYYYPDLSAGVAWKYLKGAKSMSSGDHRKLTIGASLFHVNKPKNAFGSEDDRLHSKAVLHGKGDIGISTMNIAFMPNLLFYYQGPYREINVGGMVKYVIKEGSVYTEIKSSSVAFGGHYRVGDAFIPAVVLEIGEYLFGVSYDVNVSDLASATRARGGVEISIRYVNPVRYGSRKGNPMF